MATGDLIQLQQALNFLGLSEDTNDVVAATISAASASIQQWVGYTFGSASYTRTFNGPGGDRLLLPDRPVTAVSSVTIDGLSIPACALPSPGFLADNKFVYLNGCYRFCRGVQNVTVAYTAGEDAPPDIQQACLNWVAMLYATVGQDFVPGANKLRAGDTEIDFAALTTKLKDTTLFLPPTIASALIPYRRVASS